MDQTKQGNRTLSSQEKKSLIKYALSYANAGFAVFPCEPGTKIPAGHLVPHGHLDATTNPALIRHWWRMMPAANIGLVPPSGYAVIDVDPRDGGLDTLKKYKVNGTLRAYSGGKDHGFHMYFRDSPHHLPAILGKGIQLKANGTGYVVAPPSYHPSGRQYEWEIDFDPTQIAPWPIGLGQNTPSANDEDRQGPTPQGKKLAVVSEANTLTLSQLKGVLKQIPADEYHTWIKVGQAIKSDYPDQLDLFVTWSKTSKKFKSNQDCYKKWDTFKREGVTTGTLVYLAGGKIPKPSPEEEFLDDTPKRSTGLKVVCLADVIQKKIDWLVPGYFAKGMVHCIAGHGGAGKSMVVTSLISAMSQGIDWLSGEVLGNPIDTLMITEEQLSESVSPRMELAGADMKRVHIIEGKINKKLNKDGKEIIIPWNLDDHLGDTEKWFREHPNVKLLVIDPIGSFMEGEKREIDTWKDSNVRKVLDKWVKLAESLNIAILYLAHFNKSRGSRAADKITGSSAFTTVTRMTYVVGQVGSDWLETQGYPGNGDDRIMVGVKCNIGRKPPVLVIGLEEVVGNDNPRIFMKGALANGCQGEAEELLMADVRETKKGSVTERALELIKQHPGKTRRALAGMLGVNEDNLSKSLEQLGDKIRKLRNGQEVWIFSADADLSMFS